MPTIKDIDCIFKNCSSPTLIIKPGDAFPILSVNEAFARVTNKKIEELIDVPLFAAFPDLSAKKEHSKTVEELLLRVMETRSEQKTGPFRYDLSSENSKSIRYWKSLSCPVVNENGELEYIVYSVRDVTKRVLKTPVKLEAGNDLNKFKAIALNALSGIIVSDSDGKILEANQIAAALFGYSISEITQLQRRDIVEVDDPELSEILSKREQTGKAAGEATGIRKDGTRFVCEFSSSFFCNSKGEICSANIVKDVSDRKRAEDEIKRSEKRFKALVEYAEDIISLTDQYGRVVYVNPAYEKLTGFTVQEVGHLRPANLLHPDQLKEAEQLIPSMYANPGRPFRRLNRLRHKDGRFIWVEGTVTNLLNEDGINAFVSNYRDITERKQAEELLKESEFNFRGIFENTIEGFVLTDPDLNIKAFNARAREYFLFKDSANDIQTGTSLLDYIEEPWREYFRQQVFNVLEGRLVQYTKAFNKDGEGYHCFAFSIYPVKEHGKITGICVSGRDITEQKKVEIQIENSEKKYRALVENSSDGILLISPGGAIKDVSAPVTRITGYSLSDLYETSIYSFVDPANAAEVNELLKEIQRENGKQIGNILYPIKHKDNRYRWLELTFSNMLHKEEINGIVVNFRDVTERKQTESELLKLNRRLIAAKKIAKLGYWEFDCDTQELFWSNEHYVLWGMEKSSSSVSLQTFLDTILPEDRESFLAYHAETMKGLHDTDITYRILRGDGEVRYIHALGQLTKNEKGEVVRLEGTAQDVTESIRIENNLKQSNERFKLATKATSDAIWDCDLTADTVFLGEGFMTLFGYDQQLSEVNGSWMYANIHPEDQYRVRKGIDNALSSSDNQFWTDEYRYRKAGGDYAIVINVAVIVRDTAGRPLRMIGAMKDITLRKEEEHQLRLLESVITNTTDAVIITSADVTGGKGAEIIYTNRAFLDLTGFHPTEIIGRGTDLLAGPETDQEEIAKLNQAMKNGSSCNIQTRFYKKNGDSYWGSLAIAPVRDDAGKIKNYIAINRDISNIVDYIKEIQDQNKKLREIAWVQSHLVRAPLSRILGLVNLMEDDTSPENIAELLPFLCQSARDLDDVIKDIVKKTENLNGYE